MRSLLSAAAAAQRPPQGRHRVCWAWRSSFPSENFTAAAPGAEPPPERRVKNKNAAQESSHTAQETSSYAARHTEHGAAPLQQGRICRIMAMRCGHCGRCVGGSVTCIGLRVLPHPQTAAFLLFKQIIAGLFFVCKREAPWVLFSFAGENAYKFLQSSK